MSRRLPASLAAIAAAMLSLPGPAGLAQDAPAPAALERRLDDLSLTLRFPADYAFKEKATTDPRLKASYVGKLGEASLRLRLHLLNRNDNGFQEPSEVMETIGSGIAWESPGFRFEDIKDVPGAYGEAAYATIARSTEQEQDASSVQVLRLAGLLSEWGYAVELRAQPALADAELASLRTALLQGVAYDGAVRDPKWTKAEAEERWRESVQPELADGMDDVLRTAHYVILTNSSGGKTFAKKMEECYVAIRKVFPFEEVAERRLMPVFLFRTNDQYYDFLSKQLGWSREQGKQTGGVAYGDLYTTWYEAPGDPVHIHEATHQIFKNRLFLGGGGSWFQEGVAEYMSTRDDDRGQAANLVEKGKHVHIQDFVKIQSLLFSGKKDGERDEGAAGNQYELAALLIEFLRESKFGKAHFLEWIHAVGAVPRNDVRAIEAATRRIYDVDLEGLDEKFMEYCKKR